MKTTGEFVTVDHVPYYKISNAQRLSPFFIQVASSCDIWLFMSSMGGATAGRKNALNNIFPYETDDRLHANIESGSQTIIKVGEMYWQPFERNGVNKYKITRNIYKGYYGDSVMMEEINHELNISFAYKYESSEKYGIVKTSKVTNRNEHAVSIEVLDGVGNILPYGVNELLQATTSTLVDSYKVAELLGDTMGIYSLTTQINDTPNPIEVLKANVVYTTLKGGTVYLNSQIVKAFYEGKIAEINPESSGAKSSFFVLWNEELERGQEKSYSTIMDVGYDHGKIAELATFTEIGDFHAISEDIKAGTENLRNIVKEADGIQETGDKVACASHYLNTLYNVMRGGSFENGYAFSYEDFYKFIAIRNKGALTNVTLLEELKSCTTIQELKECTEQDAMMYRLALEYMPLSFSRRHGDPSRPWNKFNIELKDDKGEKISSYEGNWRDIFQNWEALGLSFPCYYENMITKFVNASTVDGFNPYRINASGIDWEKPEEDNPFGGYGYWGDHQIIYLLRLLKGMTEHFPERADQFLSSEIFTYANIPYVLKSYDELLKNSKDTIAFDFEKDEKIEALCATIGSDGKLVHKDNRVYTVSLTEKLLVPLLSKMSNLLVGGGIWMNTQRPEWNDANNAIVGIGLSMVTVYHIKAYLEYVKVLLEKHAGSFYISEEVVLWMKDIAVVLEKYESNYQGNEKSALDEMGQIFSTYRANLYENEFKNKEEITTMELISYIQIFTNAIDYTIQNNKTTVYNTYNILTEEFQPVALATMLEGQSAVIGSGYLSADEICKLLDAMKEELLDETLKCHTLYPIHRTPRFVDKNVVSKEIGIIPEITYQDENEVIHFTAQMITADVLMEALYGMDISELEKEAIMSEYEHVFSHKKFTGRSQVMYKFEGIGCVYWHQNAKLALAVLEGVKKARMNSEDAEQIYQAYKELMQGFIYRKTPEECNAIPIEPYSHTSFNKTSEQPGMTGQVKESVIMRRLELGVKVVDGAITFDKWFLDEKEFNEDGEVSFTIYGVATKYVKGETECVVITYEDGHREEIVGYVIDCATSVKIFLRNQEVREIEVCV